MVSGITLLVLATACVGWGARTYEYIEQVGDGKEHATIQSAIDAMGDKYPPLSATKLGCIQVYEGTWIHNAGSWWGSTSNWLPEWCDLKGMEGDRNAVTIKHGSGTSVNHYVIIGAADNQISDLTVYTDIGARNGIYFHADGVLTNCEVDTLHLSVDGGNNLIVSNSQIAGLGCVRARETFKISQCNLSPAVADEAMEAPTGIEAMGAGIIRDVSIQATGASSYDSAGAGLFGIILKLDLGEQVSISNGYRPPAHLEIQAGRDRHFARLRYPERQVLDR
jgi:hypothetical protein